MRGAQPIPAEQGGGSITLVVADFDRRQPSPRQQRRKFGREHPVGVQPVATSEQSFSGLMLTNSGADRPGFSHVGRIAQDQIEAAR